MGRISKKNNEDIASLQELKSLATLSHANSGGGIS